MWIKCLAEGQKYRRQWDSNPGSQRESRAVTALYHDTTIPRHIFFIFMKKSGMQHQYQPHTPRNSHTDPVTAMRLAPSHWIFSENCLMGRDLIWRCDNSILPYSKWQKEASDKSKISCKTVKYVCHFRWCQWNIMMSLIPNISLSRMSVDA